MRTTVPLGCFGRLLKLAGFLLLVIAVWVAGRILELLFEWWMDKYLPPEAGLVFLGPFVAFMAVCIIGIEVMRRRRIRILPGSDRD